MYFTWIILVASTIWISLAAFIWALVNGQFSDQNRARYLPFCGDSQPPLKENKQWDGRERYVFLFIGAAWVAVFGAAIILSLAAP
jgi:cbb3-type cytochrome oxidase maturation protein